MDIETSRSGIPIENEMEQQTNKDPANISYLD